MKWELHWRGGIAPFSSYYNTTSVRLLMHQSPCFHGSQFAGSQEHWFVIIPYLNRMFSSILSSGMSFSVGPKSSWSTGLWLSLCVSAGLWNWCGGQWRFENWRVVGIWLLLSCFFISLQRSLFDFLNRWNKHSENTNNSIILSIYVNAS